MNGSEEDYILGGREFAFMLNGSSGRWTFRVGVAKIGEDRRCPGQGAGTG